MSYRLVPLPELGRQLGLQAAAPYAPPAERGTGGRANLVPPPLRWSQAVLSDDAPGVDRAWPTIDAADRVTAVTLAAAAGANPAVRSPVGTQPAHDAARAASASVLALLGGRTSLVHANAYGDTVLHRLALYGGEQPAQVLAACWQLVGKWVRAELGQAGWTKFLSRRNEGGFTALDLAVAVREDDLAALMRLSGAHHGARWRKRGELGYAADEVVHRPRA